MERNSSHFKKTLWPVEELAILTEPGGIAFCQFPGIAKYDDWWIVYGYTDEKETNGINRLCANV